MVLIASTGRKYKATVKGWQPKFVTCEKCGNQFVYMMERETTGTGRSPLWLDNSGAARRATEEAHANLQRSFKDDCDPVPCPGCGWYQRDMVKELRAKWVAIAIIVTILLYIGGDILIATTGWHFGLGHPYFACLGLCVLVYVVWITPIYMFYNANTDAKVAQRKAAAPDERAIPRAEYERTVAEQQRNAVPVPPPILMQGQRISVMPPPMIVPPRIAPVPGPDRPPPLPGRVQ